MKWRTYGKCAAPLAKRNSTFLLIQWLAPNTSSMFRRKRYSILNIRTDTNSIVQKQDKKNDFTSLKSAWNNCNSKTQLRFPSDSIDAPQNFQYVLCKEMQHIEYQCRYQKYRSVTDRIKNDFISLKTTWNKCQSWSIHSLNQEYWKFGISYLNISVFVDSDWIPWVCQ